jgi:hypothetical protein
MFETLSSTAFRFTLCDLTSLCLYGQNNDDEDGDGGNGSGVLKLKMDSEQEWGSFISKIHEV